MRKKIQRLTENRLSGIIRQCLNEIVDKNQSKDKFKNLIVALSTMEASLSDLDVPYNEELDEYLTTARENITQAINTIYRMVGKKEF